jgi:RNA polymerase sigma factor (sigma-70 family)
MIVCLLALLGGYANEMPREIPVMLLLGGIAIYPFYDKNLFAAFMVRLRAHDDAAAKQFVSVYEPVILRVVGHRLTRLGLSRELDPEDILQQVFLKFFAKVRDGIELASSKDLLNLLVTMTNAQIIDERRKAHAIRRSSGEHAIQHSHLEDIVSPGQLPNDQLIEQEQLELIHNLMSEEEWNLAMARASGLSWDELAMRFGKSAEALRKQLSRILDRFRHDLSVE